jgi:hypothetical protein
VKAALITAAVLACAVPALAQTTGSKATAPGTSKLPRSSAVGTSVATAPFAWVDDASVLSPGGAAFSAAAVSWLGANASETDAPVVGVAAGVAPRLQLSARVPFILGDNRSGVAGGVGTSYISGKIALVQTDGDGFKLAVAPTVQLLGNTVSSASGNRARFGLPVSAEFDSGSARVFGSVGYFAGGVGFAGGGVGVAATSRVSLAASVSRSWLSSSGTIALPTVGSDRTEVAGGAAIALTSRVAVFGSLSQTIATTDANGAGMTLVAGLLVTSSRVRP